MELTTSLNPQAIGAALSFKSYRPFSRVQHTIELVAKERSEQILTLPATARLLSPNVTPSAIDKFYQSLYSSLFIINQQLTPKAARQALLASVFTTVPTTRPE